MAFKLISKKTLIKEVGAKYIPQPNEKLFYRDLNSEQIFHKKPFVSTSSRDWKYYVVDKEEIHEQKGIQKKIEILDSSISITLIINYQFHFSGEFVNTDLLKALILNQESQQKTFENRISNTIDEYVNQTSNFINNFYNVKPALIVFLENKMLEQGITLKTTINLKENTSQDNNITGTVPIRVFDYPGKINLGFSIDLEIIESRKVEGLLSLSKPDSLKNKIANIIRNVIRDSKLINLHKLYFKTNTVVREIIEQNLTDILYDYGLTPSFIDLGTKLSNIPPKRKQIEYKIECITKNGYPVTVNHLLILTLKDLGKYFSEGIQDLDDWLESELKRYTQDYILDKEFTDLIVKFEEEEVKKGIKGEVESIGYEIKQLITMPDLQKIIPNYIKIETGKQQEFSTKNDKLKVKLNIVINAKITNIAKIAWLLNPVTKPNDILQNIEERILNVTRQYIHSIEPEDFYMKFEIPKRHSTKSLADELIDKISDKLIHDFGIENPDIICKPLETELVKKFNAIEGKSHLIEIDSNSGFIKYDIPYDVISVSETGWYRFKTWCNTININNSNTLLEQITKRIKNFIELELAENWSNDYVDVQDTVFKEEFSNYLEDGVEMIKKEFGLTIKISKGWKRYLNPLEISFEELRKKELKNNKDIKALLLDNKMQESKALINQNKLDKTVAYSKDPELRKEKLQEIEKQTLNTKSIKIEQIPSDKKEINNTKPNTL